MPASSGSSSPSWAGFPAVGFSGARALPAGRRAACRALAAAVAAAGVPVFAGCAAGADSAAVCGAGPAVRVFRAAAFAVPGRSWSVALARRSAAFVAALAAAGGCLVSFPAGSCPAGLVPARAWPSGSGSGSWASLALAVGLGVPVFVFLPAGVVPPAAWGSWSVVGSGPLAGAWSLAAGGGGGVWARAWRWGPG